ncbi:MAG TPA: hypothetical protein VED87_09500 [Methylocystis sp.]|nr:hypothetical protein [Methylocystis sp.]
MDSVTLALPPRGRAGCATPARRGRPPKTPRPAPDALSAPSTAPHLVEVVESYFDAEGRPIKRKSLGAAKVARSYDARGNQVEEAYFNADGSPVKRKGLGAARIHWRYDSRGNKVEAELFGPDGALLSKEAAILVEKG